MDGALLNPILRSDENSIRTVPRLAFTPMKPGYHGLPAWSIGDPMADMADAAKVGGIPALRLGVLNDRPPKAEGAFVVYWMATARRTRSNFALQRAVGWARELKRPLVVVEILTSGGRWDSVRHHHFVLQGMQENARHLANTPAFYYPYVEPRPGECCQFLESVSAQAAVVVTDDYPINLPAVNTVAAELPARVETIDGNGLLPLKASNGEFPTAYAFRRFLQRTLREHLLDAPQADPLTRVALPRLKSLAATIRRRWPAASAKMLSCDPAALAKLPIDHHVPAVETIGGPAAAHAAMEDVPGDENWLPTQSFATSLRSK